MYVFVLAPHQYMYLTWPLTSICICPGPSPVYVLVLAPHQYMYLSWPLTSICICPGPSPVYVLVLAPHQYMYLSWPLTSLCICPGPSPVRSYTICYTPTVHSNNVQRRCKVNLALLDYSRQPGVLFSHVDSVA